MFVTISILASPGRNTRKSHKLSGQALYHIILEEWRWELRDAHKIESGRKRFPERLRSAMVKLVYCITKKAGLADDEFFRYWKDVHGPIGARIPGLRKLVQSHRLISPGVTSRAGFDGVAELWFDNWEALLAARQSREWQESSEDEANFIDPSKVASFVSEEHIILDETGPSS